MTEPCTSIRPLLFELADGALEGPVRARATAHVASCDDCRDELTRERKLTEQLGRPRPTVRSFVVPTFVRRAAAVLLVGAGLFGAVRLITGGEAYGSIQPASLTVSMTFEDGRVFPLRSQNHVEVPFGSVTRLNVVGTTTLRVTGPAVLDLDRTEEGWKATLMRGRMHARVEDAARLVVSSVFGVRTLGPGEHAVACDAASFAVAADPDAAVSAGELLDRGLDEFFEQKRMEVAEFCLRAATEHADADPDIHSRALFYLGAALGRQKKYAEAIEVKDDWLTRYPHDDGRHYLLYFKGHYHRELGQEEEARECWRTIAEENPTSKLLERVPVR